MSVVSRFPKYLDGLDELNIYNLPKFKTRDADANFDETRYNDFITFYNTVIAKVDSEIKSGNGNIIDAYPIENASDEDLATLEKIKNEYYNMYIKPIDERTTYKAGPETLSRDGIKRKYPHFAKDLFGKSNLIYQKYDKQAGYPLDEKANPIKLEDQSDEQIFNLFGKRIKGLKQCQTYKPETMSAEEQKYYTTEYQREYEKYQELELNPDMTYSQKVEAMCKHNFNDYNTLNAYTNGTYNMKLLKDILSNPTELLYARTFLPESCFDIRLGDNYQINFDKLGELLKSGDRNYRQYVFGNYTDDRLVKLKKAIPFLYDVGGVLEKENYHDNCNPLVNFTLALDLLYSRCAISNTTPLCPFRFVLPYNSETVESRITKDNTARGATKSLSFNVRYRSALGDIFDNDMPDGNHNAEFLGIITIKYYHNETNNIRIWYLFVFKNNDIIRRTRLNLITGIREPIFLCNYRLRHINMYALFEKHAITHYELLYLIELYKKGKIHIYKPLGTDELEKDHSIFISRRDNLDNLEEYPFLKDLQLVKATLSLVEIPGDFHKIPETNIQLSYSIVSKVSKLSNLHGGNKKNNMKIGIKTTTKEDNLYFSDLVLCKYYDEFIRLVIVLDNLFWYSKSNTNIENPNSNKYNYISSRRSFINKYLQISYPYLLVDNNTWKLSFDKTTRKNISLIPKYTNRSIGFYYLNEVFQKFKLFSSIKESDSILSIDNGLALTEYISYQKYNIKSIVNIVPTSQNNYKTIFSEWQQRINEISSIYNINTVNYDGAIYDIEKNIEQTKIASNNKLIYINLKKYIDGVGKYDDYYNIPIYISGFIFSLKHLKKGGILLFNIQSVVYKHCADIILIISKYFEKYDLYYPDIHNRYKRSGTIVIFTNFNGLNDSDIQYLDDLLNKTRDIYPNEANDFNIHNPELRDELFLYKMPIPEKPQKNIISFLDYDITDEIYQPFREFNNARYFSQVIFAQKMLGILTGQNADNYLDTKLPTPDQITSSILYCKKWDIPYFDKYNTSKMESYITRNILSEMYGLTEPILYNFKTPFKTYIANKIILNPRFTQSRKLSNRASILITSYSRSHASSSKSRLDRKSRKNLSNSASMGAFLRDIFETTSHHSKITKRTTIKSRQSRQSRQSRHRSTMKRVNMSSRAVGKALWSGASITPLSLLEPIFTSNNQLVQVGRLIDSRRDFTKPVKKPHMDYDPQTWLYDKLKWEMRYYKGKGAKRQVPNLDTLVQQRLGDSSISQAWLKMYEIITDCELIPRNQKGTFRSFHICEAPGTFINALNNYIRTKTSYSDFDWMAQSLNPRTAKIADTYGLIRRHPERWDWGATRTGDITEVENIRYYMKKVQRHHGNQSINLMTSDCGLPFGTDKYELVAFASYVAILAILPRGGTMVYKILSPIDLPLIWNLIYITFTNFKELAFFKPVQNSQSREFYIVAKDYMGTSPQVIDKLLDIITRWSRLDSSGYKASWLETLDLFGDKYPEEFIAQVLAISERLAQNYVNSIERIIYYVDNNESVGEEYTRHIEKYMEEKNEDWIRKYRPRKLENKWIL